MVNTKFLTIKNIQALFGIAHMTAYNWRLGSSAREPIPTVTDKQKPHLVLFKPAEVKAWAKKHKVLMLCDPASLVGTEIPANKPKAKPVAKKAATAIKQKKPVAKAVAKVAEDVKEARKTLAKSVQSGLKEAAAKAVKEVLAKPKAKKSAKVSKQAPEQNTAEIAG